MAGRGLSTPAVVVAAGAAVLVWSGVKGVAPATALRDFLGGHQPPTPAGGPLGLVSPTAVPGFAPGPGSAVGAQIAAAASGYVGTGGRYRFGGGSPAGWDCSGFVNYVLNHDLGLAIPGYARGGTFTGRAHGPVVAQWAVWSGAQTIPTSAVQAGDLVIWPVHHMGIAVDATTMVNAPGPNGTPAPVLHSIAHGASGPMIVRRLRAAGVGNPPGTE